MQGAATFAVVAAQLQQAVEDDAGAHGVPNKGHRPVAMRALHQYMRQQPPRLRAAGNFLFRQVGKACLKENGSGRRMRPASARAPAIAPAARGRECTNM